MVCSGHGSCHANTPRGRAVVFSDCYSSIKSHFEPGTGTSSTAEEVHDDLILQLVETKVVLSFEIESVFFCCADINGPRRYSS